MANQEFLEEFPVTPSQSIKTSQRFTGSQIIQSAPITINSANSQLNLSFSLPQGLIQNILFLMQTGSVTNGSSPSLTTQLFQTDPTGLFGLIGSLNSALWIDGFAQTSLPPANSVNRWLFTVTNGVAASQSGGWTVPSGAGAGSNNVYALPVYNDPLELVLGLDTTGSSIVINKIAAIYDMLRL